MYPMNPPYMGPAPPQYGQNNMYMPPPMPPQYMAPIQGYNNPMPSYGYYVPANGASGGQIQGGYGAGGGHGKKNKKKKNRRKHNRNSKSKNATQTIFAPPSQNKTVEEMVSDILRTRSQSPSANDPSNTVAGAEQIYANDLLQKIKLKLPRRIDWKVKSSYKSKEEKEMRKIIAKMRKGLKASATKAKGMTTIKCKSSQRVIRVVGVSVSDKKKVGTCQYLKQLKEYAKKRCDGLPICRIPNRNLRLEERCPKLNCAVYLDIRCQSTKKGRSKMLSKKMEFPWIRKSRKKRAGRQALSCDLQGLMKMIRREVSRRQSLKYCSHLMKLVKYAADECEDSGRCRIPERILRAVEICPKLSSNFDIDAHCKKRKGSKFNPHKKVRLDGVSKSVLFKGKYAILCFRQDKRGGLRMAQNGLRMSQASTRHESDTCPLLDGNRLESMVDAIRNSNTDNAKIPLKSPRRQRDFTKNKRTFVKKFKEKVKRKTGDSYASRRRHRYENHRLDELKSNHVISSRDLARLRKFAGRYHEPQMSEDLSRGRRNPDVQQIPGNARCYKIKVGNDNWKDLELLSRVSRRDADAIEIERLKTRRNDDDENPKSNRNHENFNRQRTELLDSIQQQSWHHGEKKLAPKSRELEDRGRGSKAKWTEVSGEVSKRANPGSRNQWSNYSASQ